jgi:hypothetical protein
VWACRGGGASKNFYSVAFSPSREAFCAKTQ